MEKYGELPKRFSKAWWEHYWYYYKWYVFAALAAVFLITVTCVQCANQPKYDVFITYAGVNVNTDEAIEAFCADLEANVIDDIDENGEKSVGYLPLTMGVDGTPGAATEFESGMQTKLVMEFQAGDTYLFLFSRQELMRLLDREYGDRVFMPVAEWADDFESIPKGKLEQAENTDYAVNISGNPYFKNLGFKTDDLYIAIRYMRNADADKPKEQQAFSNAKAIGNYILSFDEEE